MKNIKEVNINYSTSKMRVIADDATAFEQLTAEVKKLGYTLSSKGYEHFSNVHAISATKDSYTFSGPFLTPPWIQNEEREDPPPSSLDMDFNAFDRSVLV